MARSGARLAIAATIVVMRIVIGSANAAAADVSAADAPAGSVADASARSAADATAFDASVAAAASSDALAEEAIASVVLAAETTTSGALADAAVGGAPVDTSPADAAPARGVARADSAGLLAGAAKRELVLAERVPLAGYSRRRGKPSTGMHDPVEARAVVLSNGVTQVAVVSADLLIVDEALASAVASQLPPSMRLLLAATHTHSGPGAYGRKFFEKLSMGHYDERVANHIVSSIAAAVREAAGRLQPVTASHASVQTEGLVENRMEHGDTVARELALLSFRDAQGQPLAVIANFSAHPTTLGASNMLLSADYPGVLARAIERRYPGAVCLFLAGSVADQAPVKQGDGFEPAQRLGDALADVSIRALETGPTVVASASARAGGSPIASESPTTGGELAVIQRRVRLPRARLRLGRFTLPSLIGSRFVDDDADLTVIRIGRTALLGVPCDFSAELGEQLKAGARQAGYDPIVVGFANDYIGYCLPERLYDADEYESSMAFNGPHAGALLTEQLLDMVRTLGTQQPP